MYNLELNAQKMKKLLKWALPCLFLATLATACSDDDNNGKQGTELTPDENKARLDAIGTNLLSKIDPNAHKTLIDVVDHFSGIIETLEMEENAIEEQVSVIKAISRICEKSDFEGMMAFTSARSAIYKASDYYGIYTYNETTREWSSKVPSDNALEFHFDYKSKPVVIKLAATGKETELEVEGEQVAIPENVNLLMTLGNEKLCGMDVNSQLSTTAHTAKIDATLSAGGYSFNATAYVSKSKATCGSSMKKGDEVLIKSDAEVNGQNMTDPSEDDLDNPENLFGKAWGEVSILNDVNFKIECSNIKNFANKLDQVDHSQDALSSANSYKYDDEVSTKEEAEIFNEYLKGEMRYAESDAVIATFAFQAYLDYSYEYSNSSYKYWDIEPLIVFATDDSRFSLEEFFDEVSFKGLIESAERLLDEYESLY